MLSLSNGPPKVAGSRSQALGGPKVAHADNGFPLRVSGGRGHKGGEDLVLAKTTVVFSGDSDIKTGGGAELKGGMMEAFFTHTHTHTDLPRLNL